MIGRLFAIGASALAASGLLLSMSAAPGEAQERGRREPGDRLGSLIQERIRADGPFLTGRERAVIEQACGYAPGSWDGNEVNMSNGVFTCTDGRRVDSPQVRAVMAEAGPRIGARVRRVMESAEVQGAIGEVAEQARAEALRSIDSAEIGRRAAAEARAGVRRAMAEMERDLAEERRERRRPR